MVWKCTNPDCSHPKTFQVEGSQRVYRTYREYDSCLFIIDEDETIEDIDTIETTDSDCIESDTDDEDFEGNTPTCTECGQEAEWVECDESVLTPSIILDGEEYR